MSRLLILLTAILFAQCYSIPNIEGFDQGNWLQSAISCEDNRMTQADLLVEQQGKLLGEGQAEIKTLLGQPTEHELYNRNQKFFYYQLVEGDSCANRRLSVRFDALDRVKEIRIIQ